MSTLADFKKNRKKSLESLTKKINDMQTPNNRDKYKDPLEEKFWKPTRDSAGNAFAVIRFLGNPDDPDDPFRTMWRYSFQTNKGWYIEKSRKSIGKEDPAVDLFFKLRGSDNEEDKERAKTISRRVGYITNIYVVKDSGNPENEGKVFLYEFGQKVYDKINSMLFPDFEDEDPVNIYDFWDGANFRLKIRIVNDWPNYDRCEWDAPAPLFEDDKDLEAVVEQMHSLNEVFDEKYFKSYEDLQARLFRVMGISEEGEVISSNKEKTNSDDDEVDISSLLESDDEPSIESDDDDDDDDIARFRELAKS